jgi:hypothetical protein
VHRAVAGLAGTVRDQPGARQLTDRITLIEKFQENAPIRPIVDVGLDVSGSLSSDADLGFLCELPQWHKLDRKWRLVIAWLADA